ncbi:hypothetical protein HYH03_005033 [Edaphochlamys debaryana]|uniref:Uncharacterized protein n=1 Tax=Edaphochlamys debaryana TaxID=47281 RepID=A0A835YDY2_9CHLO|nr:hypothetical protein HYH03_005033 [Edaphochlamys debaryana]|eukprot:KAG2497030.1 hypothetical protein HYH03_005033 [Edaphochlamys debaryana]
MHPGLSALLGSSDEHKDARVLVAEPRYKEVTVLHTTDGDGVLRNKHHESLLHLTEDRRNPDALAVTFKALQSTCFKKYTGTTVYRPVTDPATGRVVGSRAESTQDILPKGTPQWLSRMPLVGRILREACLKHVRGLVLELDAAANKVVAHAAATGVSHAEAVEAVCDPTGEWAAKQAEELRQAATQRQQGLRSFAFDDAWEEEEEDDDEIDTVKEGDEAGEEREGEREGERAGERKGEREGEGQGDTVEGAATGVDGERDGVSSRKAAVLAAGMERHASTASDDVGSCATADQS